MRCPGCGSLDDKVVDSRQADDGNSIRRRRQCVGCSRRFTTFERVEEASLAVLKRSGEREPFDRAKVIAGVVSATTGRPGGAGAAEELASAIEDSLRLDGRREVTSAEIGEEVLERLRTVDAVAAVRFASVYKAFDDPADFAREVDLLADADPAAAVTPPPAEPR